MKPFLLLLVTLSSYNLSLAQQQWFEVFPDTIGIKIKGVELVRDFQEMVTEVDSLIDLGGPTLSYNAWGPFYLQPQNTIYLPIWDLSPQEFQIFCADLAGSQSDGKRMFGLFFNGFYVAHEVAHALQFATNTRADNEFDNEYTANALAILYWREMGRQRELDDCYQLAQRALLKMEDPIPDGADVKTYLTEHYGEIAKDPYKYGYIQFSQFIVVYKDSTLSDFRSFIRENILQK